MSVLLALVALAVVMIMIMLVSRGAVPAHADVAWLAGPSLLPPVGPSNGDVADVCRRYLTRHRRHRLAGGLFGMLFAGVVGVRWFGSITIGIGQGSPLADLLFCGVAGVIVGALSAESFRLGTGSNAQRAASLSPRQPMVLGGLIAVSRVVAVAAIVVGASAGIVGHGYLALVTSLILVAPLFVAERVVIVIASRSRPAMTDRAQHLDGRLRAFAGASLSHLHLAVTALMLGWTLAKVDSLTGVLSVVRFAVVIGCLVIALVMLRRASPRPSDRLLFHDASVA